MRRLKIGLALGGGGARGLAHIGVLKSLISNGIPVDIITGTSMGAVIGALYAFDPDVQSLEERVLHMLSSESFKRLGVEFLQQSEGKTRVQRFLSHLKQTYLHNLARTRLSVISGDKAESFLSELLPDKDIVESVVPFAAVATDLTRAEEIVFTSGPVRRAVYASMAIAGIFPPLAWEGRWMVDGGVVSIVPVKAAFEMGADMVIAVDVKSRARFKSKLDTGFEVISRSNYIRGMVINRRILETADLVVSPGVKNVHWAGFKKAAWIIGKGEHACGAKIPEIKAMIRKKSIKTFIKRLFSKT
ncbi:MAG: patatin-like phospholipase family protein [bacterium]